MTGRRREFNEKARLAMIKRATRDGVTRCELCDGASARWEYHHTIEEELVVDKSSKLTEDDGLLVCIPCHADVTATQSIPRVAKAKRREARHLGAHRPKAKIQSRGFAPSAPKDKTLTKLVNGASEIARRFEK